MQLGFFDVEDKYSKLSKLGDPLEKISKLVDFSLFDNELHKAFHERPKSKRSNPKNAGRKPLNPMQMFKILFLKKLFNLSNEQVEFQLTDRHSFQRFVGLSPNKNAPDYTTVWRYEELLAKKGKLKALFKQFEYFLAEQGFEAKTGAIVDATIVEVPRQRNNRNENQQIKQGKTPKSFKDKPAMLAQKDLDARWTKKNGQNFYGYKNHILIDAGYKLVRDYEVTPASTHDSQPAPHLFASALPDFPGYGDSAYLSDDIREVLKKNGMEDRINEKGYKHKPLTKEQEDSNREKSHIRSRVEHVFGFMVNSMNGKSVRSIGIKRANVQIGFSNLVYNICRYCQLVKSDALRV